MIALAQAVLWWLIGVIVICGIVWIVLYVLAQFLPIPPIVEKAVWLVVMLLVLIYALTLIAGGGGMPFRFSKQSSTIPSTRLAAASTPTSGHMSPSLLKDYSQ